MFHSVLASESVAETLLQAIDNEFTPRSMLPWFIRLVWKGRSRIVCGVVRGNTFRLKKRDAALWSPNFYGKWEAQRGGTEIEGYFDLAPLVKLSLRITLFVVLGAAIIGIVLNMLDLRAGTHFTVDPRVGLWISVLLVAFVFASYWFVHVIGSRLENSLLAFLEQRLAATRVR